MAGDPVLYDVDAGVALITLNRPERNNAWSGTLQTAYFDLLDRAAADDEVRAVVVTGAGRSFCPGADMAELADGTAADISDKRPIIHPLGLPKPLIAAVNGGCAGIGLAQALLCDLRFAAAGARITTAFARRGLVAEHGTSWLLPRVVGAAVAADLLLSARVVTAEEAEGLGLVNRVLPPESLLAETLAYARDLAASCSPAAMAAIKRQLAGQWDQDVVTALREANRLMVQSLRGPDHAEGVASFLEKRAPAFAPLGHGSRIG